MIKKISTKVTSEFNKYLRVWRLLKKPTIDEFKTISKVSAVGIMVIGALGFAISVTMTIILK
jgi:protein translocase SEC61 complex gamma subunit